MRPLYETNGLLELRIPYSVVNISNSFGPYSTEMSWAQPDYGAAVLAMRQIHFRPAHYRLRASFARRDALKMLSATTLGRKMRVRLAEIRDCFCISAASRANNLSACSTDKWTAIFTKKARCDRIEIGQTEHYLVSKPEE